MLHIKGCILSDMLKEKEGAMVAAQSHGMQDNNLSMKMPTKFTEASARSWPRLETLHKVNSEARTGVEALHGRCMPNHGRGRIRAAALQAWHNQRCALQTIAPR